MPQLSIGLDFGTSNTVLALAAGGDSKVVTFDHRGESLTGFISALCFWQQRVKGIQTARVEAGPWAVDEFLEGLDAHRFMQSFKSFAASATFRDTRILGAAYAFEDLLATFLKIVFRHARLETGGARLVVGRPVRFAGANPDAALAMRRYRDAFARAGLEGARFVYEPVAAAFHFARRLERDATVLVADFGGGTSDFSVMRFEKTTASRARALGHAGVGIAGDTFDHRIIDHVVSPRLGKGTSYRSFGKTLAIPVHYFANFARWNHLALMKSNGDLKELRELIRSATAPDRLAAFAELIEHDLGFPLYRAVSRAKTALSSAESADFAFRVGDVDLSATIARAQFEEWIADDLQRIRDTVSQALRAANVTQGGIERVFLTGGSSFVPAVRRIFSESFGEERLVSSDQFESIASGLALIGQSPDIGDWTAEEEG
ncbi:Hsp70 family protein [Alsobacter sp. SYSU M60028]|uniref:Hsp70 family protein n=1 Tax=Alsobacter ponti TaxID=2962936 RepID=A0ABT1LAM2_9HYPH|nr:Hsp70 family protein [Alsobacter ponti]MCP8938537.1 Hsp70 family protein [Alsobacter ponti]